MQVTAISTPTSGEWRWRICDYRGVTVEESRVGFPSIPAAVAAGTERLVTMSVVDRSDSTSRAWPLWFGPMTGND
jgi:hypothetical protein